MTAVGWVGRQSGRTGPPVLFRGRVGDYHGTRGSAVTFLFIRCGRPTRLARQRSPPLAPHPRPLNFAPLSAGDRPPPFGGVRRRAPRFWGGKKSKASENECLSRDTSRPEDTVCGRPRLPGVAVGLRAGSTRLAPALSRCRRARGAGPGHDCHDRSASRTTR